MRRHRLPSATEDAGLWTGRNSVEPEAGRLALAVTDAFRPSLVQDGEVIRRLWGFLGFREVFGGAEFIRG